MNERLHKALDDAIAQRGKNKGMLKAKCPPMGTDGAVMWTALMMYANPFKVGMGHTIIGGLLDPEFKDECDQFAAEHAGVLKNLDRDRVALDRLGGW